MVDLLEVPVHRQVCTVQRSAPYSSFISGCLWARLDALHILQIKYVRQSQKVEPLGSSTNIIDLLPYKRTPHLLASFKGPVKILLFWGWGRGVICFGILFGTNFIPIGCC